MTDTLVRHLRIGICDDKCRSMEARSGCMCAEAADEIERLKATFDMQPTTAEIDAAIDAWASEWCDENDTRRPNDITAMRAALEAAARVRRLNHEQGVKDGL